MADPVEEFEKYREELLEGLGDRDPVDVLRSSLDEAVALVDGKSPEDLARQPSDGGWSAHQVLAHLCDSDFVYGVRIRMVLTADRPPIVGYDQDAWVKRFGALDDPQETFALWRQLREANLRLYSSVTREESQMVGVHTERGEESVDLMLRMLGGHDLMHLDQLKRCLA